MMPKNPLVSVVIPVFNGASFIVRAVESVLVQTWKDAEIIIIDDGSTDDTQGVLSQFANRSNLTCLHQDNAGPAQARNVGIKAATGDYIAFLDCDDIWFPDKLETQVTILREKSQSGLVHANYEVIDRMGRVIQHAKAGQSCDSLHKAFSGGHAPLLSTTVVSRVLLERVGGFDSKLWVSEDSDLILRLYDVVKFECVDRTLVHKFQQAQHNDAKPTREAKLGEKVLSSRERFLARVQKRPTLNREQQLALNREWSSLSLLKGAYDEGQGRWQEARQHYVAAIQKEPFRLRGYTRWLRALRP